MSKISFDKTSSGSINAMLDRELEFISSFSNAIFSHIGNYRDRCVKEGEINTDFLNCLSEFKESIQRFEIKLKKIAVNKNLSDK